MTRTRDLLAWETASARYLLGFIFLINGLNWWWKLLPYPSLHDPVSPMTPAFIQAMIDTGFLFAAVRVLEVIFGFALLANRFVPLTLVAMLPVTLTIAAVDLIMLRQPRAEVMGWATILLNSFLLLRYLRFYRPMLCAKASPA